MQAVPRHHKLPAQGAGEPNVAARRCACCRSACCRWGGANERSCATLAKPLMESRVAKHACGVAGSLRQRLTPAQPPWLPLFISCSPDRVNGSIAANLLALQEELLFQRQWPQMGGSTMRRPSSSPPSGGGEQPKANGREGGVEYSGRGW